MFYSVYCDIGALYHVGGMATRQDLLYHTLKDAPSGSGLHTLGLLYQKWLLHFWFYSLGVHHSAFNFNNLVLLLHKEDRVW